MGKPRPKAFLVAVLGACLAACATVSKAPIPITDDFLSRGGRIGVVWLDGEEKNARLLVNDTSNSLLGMATKNSLMPELRARLLKEKLSTAFNNYLPIFEKAFSHAGFEVVKIDGGFSRDELSPLDEAKQDPNLPPYEFSWKVSDEATRVLMTRFYENLVAKNMPAGEALRVAKYELSSVSRFRQPIFWAPFVMYGLTNS